MRTLARVDRVGTLTLGVVALFMTACAMTACARVDNAQPAPVPTVAVTVASSPSGSTAAPAAPTPEPAAEPAAPAESAATPSPSASSKPSGINGPCFTSLVRTADGKPSAEQKCAPGLACDYRDAVPDGPGKCRRR